MKTQILRPHPQSFRFSRSGAGPENVCFSQVPRLMLMLLIWGPHLENLWSFLEAWTS